MSKSDFLYVDLCYITTLNITFLSE